MPTTPKERLIAKNTNTFLKKKREMDKKAKAEAKLARRIAKKKRGNDHGSAAEPENENQVV